MSDVLEQIAATLEQRKGADPASSYVASLHHKGLNRILEKVGGASGQSFQSQLFRGKGADVVEDLLPLGKVTQ